MENWRPQYFRVLGIDPCTRGFAFVVLESSGRVLGRGVSQIVPPDMLRLVDRAEGLIKKYRPAAIAVEDCSNTRRGPRAQQEIDRLIGLAHLYAVRIILVSRGEARKALGLAERATKYAIAVRLVEMLPELAPVLPPKPKAYTPERERMNIFDAAALALSAARDLPS
jgi:hypothetical protein